MANREICTYLRVSSVAQGRSGLGLEAQREALARFADAEGLKIVSEFVEVETGGQSSANVFINLAGGHGGIGE